MTASDTDRFSTLPLAPEQLKNLQDLGFSRMTPIQARALPEVLAGRDILAQAKTGSGKTAAFGLGILHHIDTHSKQVQALVVCPTRELADQVSKELRRLAQAMANVKVVSICGGKPFGPQKATLAYGAHIVVGTPGRLLDHLQKRSLDISQVKTLVLDEADRMLDMGFTEDVQTIISFAPDKRQTLLFSATYPDEIRRMSATVQHKPMDIKIEEQHQNDVIEQLFYEVKKHERNAGLLALFEHYNLSSALVFCHTKRDCDEVAEFLNQHRIAALAIHGDLEQRDRDKVLVQFANHSTSVLVATDVAARGLDIKSLPTVINYELPHDPEIYTHRIGRTGRAGEVGQAFSLFTSAEQVRLNAIEAHRLEPCICDVLESLDRNPDFVLQAPMVTIEINVGRKQKIRPGDILGSLTGDGGLAGAQIGKIDIFDHHCFVAIEASNFRKALGFLSNGKVKGRSVRARRIR
ncbi:MAG: ATP-dependent RNA helicase DbpA [Pseudomonadales bacterium]|jgi:ATP-independent RNA helicase DbpA|nr:ATP-dependent RNA helicase DbpA [Pseudomonadales bacterium]